jgi:RimJ/RimL family protein N-acetyltransferase
MIDFGYGVALGPLQRHNCELYRYQRNLPVIRKWCRQFDVIGEEQQVRWFEAQDKDPKIRMYEVVHDGLPVGVCGLTDIDHVNQRAEFSLYIFAEQQGKGYGRNALKTLFTHGFRNLNLNVIWGESYSGNPAINMFLRMGMIREGQRQQFYYRDGGFIDAHLVSITRDRWKA